MARKTLTERVAAVEARLLALERWILGGDEVEGEADVELRRQDVQANMRLTVALGVLLGTVLIALLLGIAYAGHG